MLPCFPPSYDDELLYSRCARFQEWANYESGTTLTLELFGVRRAISMVAPGPIDYLADNLPPGNKLNGPDAEAGRIVENNTLIPYFCHFLTPNGVYAARRSARSGGSAMFGVRTYLLPWSGVTAYLKYCPECVKADRLKYGESYWHRVHQLPGLHVCPRHMVWLEDTYEPLQQKPNCVRLMSAEQALERCGLASAQHVHVSDSVGGKLAQIAKDSQWLLHNKSDGTTLEKLGGRYRFLLQKCGSHSVNGVLNPDSVCKALLEYYPVEMLGMLGCAPASKGKLPWASKVILQGYKVLSHPIAHLLIIQFLGYRVAEFLQLPSVPHTPFDCGPWLCLNVACPYYNRQVIDACEIGIGPYQERIGEFACSCGFVYQRRAFKHRGANPHIVCDVKSTGEAWDAKLVELSADPDIGLMRASEILGVPTAIIRKQAERLGVKLDKSRKQASTRE